MPWSLKLCCALESDPAHRCVIGSVKSTVGHLLTGAGGAAMMKVLLALRHETLPPTANFHKPSTKIDYQRGRYRVLDSAQPWDRRAAGVPRRAAISGFGFGGINAHLLVEEWLPELTDRNVAPIREADRNVCPTSVAVVAMSVHLGAVQGIKAFYHERFDDPRSSSELLQSPFRIDELHFPIGEFPIPPNELEELLPQQLLMLQVADSAIKDVRSGLSSDGARRGVFIGLNVDLNTTNFHLRWWLQKQYGGQLPPELDAALPPLSAARTMGALASIAASRIARTFRCGGASFTITGGEDSGLQALEVAMRALQNREIDEAIVGAVDLMGDPRALRALRLEREKPISSWGEGAAALVLKRSDETNGDHVYAVLESIDRVFGSIEPSKDLYFEMPELGRFPYSEETAGHPASRGELTGLLSLTTACLALGRHLLPMSDGRPAPATG